MSVEGRVAFGVDGDGHGRAADGEGDVNLGGLADGKGKGRVRFLEAGLLHGDAVIARQELREAIEAVVVGLTVDHETGGGRGYSNGRFGNQCSLRVCHGSPDCAVLNLGLQGGKAQQKNQKRACQKGRPWKAKNLTADLADIQIAIQFQ